MNASSSPALARPRRMHGKRSLAMLLSDPAEHGVFSVAHAADLALDICDLLARAHANGVVHGQLGLRCVRLVFGNREPHGPEDVEIFTLTAETDGEVEEGAEPFLAPEQRELLGAFPIDARADIFALGAILYAVLLGEAPSEGLLTGEEPLVVDQDAHDAMPSSLLAILESCLAITPDLRPRDVDELTEKIASFATWPPDRFARLAERREELANAERARRALEARGLANMPDVLDRLDEAALSRARRESAIVPTAAPITMKSGAVATAAAPDGDRLDRLIAKEIPALTELADDEDAMPTVVRDEIEETTPLPQFEIEVAGAVQSGVTVPLEMPEPVPSPLASPSGVPSVFLAPSLLAETETGPRSRAVYVAVAAVVAIAAVTAFIMLTRSSATSVTMVTSAAPRAPTTSAATNVASPAPTSSIPVFSANALPEVAPVSPLSLPNAPAAKH